jgi:hypothetical protein
LVEMKLEEGEQMECRKVAKMLSSGIGKTNLL